MNRVALVLAAGRGRRFGGDKLSAPLHGEPLLAHAIRAARAAPVARVLVVSAPDLDIGRWDYAPPVEPVRIASTALSASLKAGIAAAGDADGAFVFLGDMPLVPQHVAGRLAAIVADRFAAVPRQGGQRGHPVLLSRAAFAQVAQLEGDRGLGLLLEQRDDIAFLDDAGEGCLIDVDRADDLARIEASGERTK